MTEDRTPGPNSPALSKGDRVEVVKILVLAVISFLAGFALVFLFLRPSSPTVDDVEMTTPEAEDLATEDGTRETDEASGDRYAPDNPPPTGDQEGGYAPAAADDGEQAEDIADQGDAPAEVPPGKTPDEVLLDGDAFYLKCWGDDGVEHKGTDCDDLDVLEKRFSTRLYVVDNCRVEKAGESSHGKLSVAAEVDFARGTISFWNGASSDLKNASEVGACLRDSLSGLPIHGVDHKFSRYRIFFTVLFGDSAEKKKKEEAASAAKFVAGKGRLVEVTKDRVRVRKTPVDGDIIGKISTGSQVRFLKKKDGWCNIITPNNNEGWMICDALAL